MTWYYADAGRQVGPIEEAALDDLVKAGIVRDDTLVWREGMPNWQPHVAARGVRPEPPPPPTVPAAETGFCSECGRSFPASQLLNLGNAAVCAQCKPVYLQRVREGGQAIGARRYAGFWIRFVAFVIDAIIIGVVNIVLTIPLRLTSFVSLTSDPSAALSAGLGMIGISVLVSMALAIAYNAYFLSTKGATLGKQILGLKVIRSDGGPISVGRAIGRYFSQMVSGMILYIGFIIAGFDSEKRALHDYIVDTRVIHTR
jgi:uncharacterized RDD family membrane protein YckC